MSIGAGFEIGGVRVSSGDSDTVGKPVNDDLGDLPKQQARTWAVSFRRAGGANIASFVLDRLTSWMFEPFPASDS